MMIITVVEPFNDPCAADLPEADEGYVWFKASSSNHLLDTFSIIKIFVENIYTLIQILHD
jgi:hypothetical protein